MGQSRTALKNGLKLLIKSVTIHCSVATLILTPIPLLGAKKQDKKDGIDGWKTASSLISQIGNAYLQNKNQQMNQLQQMQLMSQMSVKPIRSKYFPNCMIAPITPVPQGVCDNISDPNALQSARTYEQIAVRNIDTFEKLKRKDQNARIAPYGDGRTPMMTSGIACLKQNQALVQSQLQDKLNYLEALAAKIEKQNQLFKEQNKKLLDGMKDLTAELDGGGDNLEAKSRDFSKLVGKQCNDVLASSLMTGRGVGLRNISASLSQGDESLYSKANFIIQDQATLKEQLNAQIHSLQNGIKNGNIKTSIDDAENLSKRTTTFGPLKSIYELELKKHIDKYNSLKKEFSQFTDSNGSPILKLPPLDQNFDDRIAEINPKTLLENSLVEDCITFDGKLSTEQILNSLEQKSTHNKGTRLIHVKDELRKVLESTSNIEDPKYIEKKLDAIKRIDQSLGKGEISISLNSSYWGNSANHRYSTYELFANLYNQCKAKYKAGLLDNGKSNRINNALKRLAKFKQENRTFSSQLANKLSNEILNCPSKGRGTSGSCKSPSAMDPQSESFCLRLSVTCAKKVTSCYKKVQNEITLRENKIKTLALQYNKNVENFIAEQEKYYASLKGQVFRESGVLKQFFEGAGMKFLGGQDRKNKLFIAMPELKDSQYGVKLRGVSSTDDKMEFLHNLPQAIDHLKELMQQQASAIKKKIDEHIKGQYEVLKTNLIAWKKVKRECQRAEQGYLRMAKEANKKTMEKYQENQEALHNFCNQLDNMRESQYPTCDDDNSPSSLVKTMDKVANQLNPEARKLALHYRDYCNSHSNKEQEGEEIENPRALALRLCFDAKGKLDKNGVTKYLKKHHLGNLLTKKEDDKSLSKRERYIVMVYKHLKDEKQCEDLNTKLQAQCKKINSNEDCSAAEQQTYIKKALKVPPTFEDSEFEQLASYVKAQDKTSVLEWQSLGEQEISNCTANNNIQQSMKGMFNDISAIQKGFNKGYQNR